MNIPRDLYYIDKQLYFTLLLYDISMSLKEQKKDFKEDLSGSIDIDKCIVALEKIHKELMA